MDIQQPTSRDAVKFYLQNSGTIDLPRLIAFMASRYPGAFLQFIEDAFGADADAVGHALAKRRPEEFLDLMKTQTKHFEAASEAVKVMATNKVAAIKLIRQAWGFGLKEAKDIADNLCVEMGKRGMMTAPSYGVLPLSDPAMVAAYDVLLSHLGT